MLIMEYWVTSDAFLLCHQQHQNQNVYHIYACCMEDEDSSDTTDTFFYCIPQNTSKLFL